MKYKYSEKYQEAAILDHKGVCGIRAGEKLLKHLQGSKKPVLSIILKHEGRYVSYNYNHTLAYGQLDGFHFCGFGAACLGADNMYSNIVNRYKIKNL